MATTINVAATIDEQPIGGFQLRAFLLCGLVLFVDGFDVQSITYVAPAISRDWDLARGALGPTFSAGLFGVMLGALLLAPLADRIGRRRVIVYSCVAFGIGTLATVMAGTLTELLAIRFLTGLGLGSALPNAIGLASEYAPKRRRATVVTFVGSGISLGAIGAGMAAANLIAPYGWRSVFVVGGVLPLLLAAALWRGLPESLRFAAVVPARQAEARRLLAKLKGGPQLGDDVRVVSGEPEGGKTTVADLFKDQRGVATVLLWIAFFMSLLNVYFAINWLPTSLTSTGFDVTQAAVMTTFYHVGGVAGTYALGLLMDKLGAHRMQIVALLVAIVGLYVFATVSGMSQMTTTVVLMFVGFGVVGGQVGVNALASMTYPVAMRSTGLGWALGVGRVGSIVGPTIGGIMLASAHDPRAVYLVCIAPAIVGIAAVALLKRRATAAAALGQPAPTSH
jgi:AAHS family 4-hydroxybenzoate transporter-like MFS transporter